MTNREMFHQMLNSRPDPRRAYEILSGMASTAAALKEGSTQYPNIRKLAEAIYDTGCADQIMAALPALLGIALQKGGNQE
jgi:hypothetical protein